MCVWVKHMYLTSRVVLGVLAVPYNDVGWRLYLVSHSSTVTTPTVGHQISFPLTWHCSTWRQMRALLLVIVIKRDWGWMDRAYIGRDTVYVRLFLEHQEILTCLTFLISPTSGPWRIATFRVRTIANVSYSGKWWNNVGTVQCTFNVEKS